MRQRKTTFQTHMLSGAVTAAIIAVVLLFMVAPRWTAGIGAIVALYLTVYFFLED